MNKLRLVLGLQLLFFAAWGGWLLASRNADTPEFYLATSPVDPRDLISGTYVALSYDISRPEGGACASFTGFGPLFVKLEDLGKTAVTEAGPVPVYEATDCAKTAPQAPGWAAAAMQYNGRLTAVYGIEKFFLNENDPRKDARSGSVLAKVKIDKNRKLVLLDLVKKL
ncbi:MAG: GDYXXLXY domain-containing protein [Elusimicrobiales bacterium]|nr:GDYXXLXY domain-containing protein [Elusimicrobiales bacterium]